MISESGLEKFGGVNSGGDVKRCETSFVPTSTNVTFTLLLLRIPPFPAVNSALYFPAFTIATFM